MKLKEKENHKVHYHLTHLANKILKWKILSEYVTHFGKYHITWLKELAEKYKARGEYPAWGVITLPSYYEDIRDKEVAAFAGTLLKEDCTYEHIQEMRAMLGKNPWGWFKNRGFVQLSLGNVQDYKTGGVRNWKISQMFERLWYSFDIGVKNIRREITLDEVIWSELSSNMLNVYDTLYYMIGEWVCKPSFNLRLLVYLFVNDFKVLSCISDNWPCPMADGIRDFIKTWIPDYRGQMGTLDEAISLFGFENHFDFLFAYLGYEALKKKNPKGCSAYATTYHRWYTKGIRMRKSQWKTIQPKIKL